MEKHLCELVNRTTTTPPIVSLWINPKVPAYADVIHEDREDMLVFDGQKTGQRDFLLKPGVVLIAFRRHRGKYVLLGEYAFRRREYVDSLNRFHLRKTRPCIEQLRDVRFRTKNDVCRAYGWKLLRANEWRHGIIPHYPE